MKISPEPVAKRGKPQPEAWIKIVEERVAALRFGTVQIVVHEGRVTQVESTERTRFNPSETAVV